VADSLVDVSKRMKFEGWLLNVEVVVEEENIPMLKHFVHYLTRQTKKKIDYGRVLWYDSVTTDGKLVWQNELNFKNE
jgi:mannosyl-glycoprotein endo-beta-N-acetylglucosaminidase